MGLIVGLTGAAGLLVSLLLLHAGVTATALLAASGVLLALLWWWLRAQAEDYRDLPDLPGSAPSRCAGPPCPFRRMAASWR